MREWIYMHVKSSSMLISMITQVLIKATDQSIRSCYQFSKIFNVSTNSSHTSNKTRMIDQVIQLVMCNISEYE